MISNEQVKRIAKLAKLKISDPDITNFAHQLSSIMDMIDELNKIDCSGVAPLTSCSEVTLRTREDRVTVSDISDQIFSNSSGQNAALAQKIKYFIVPKVVE